VIDWCLMPLSWREQVTFFDEMIMMTSIYICSTRPTCQVVFF
jgi:hypothetical protein